MAGLRFGGRPFFSNLSGRAVSLTRGFRFQAFAPVPLYPAHEFLACSSRRIRTSNSRTVIGCLAKIDANTRNGFRFSTASRFYGDSGATGRAVSNAFNPTTERHPVGMLEQI